VFGTVSQRDILNKVMNCRSNHLHQWGHLCHRSRAWPLGGWMPLYVVYLM